MRDNQARKPATEAWVKDALAFLLSTTFLPSHHWLVFTLWENNSLAELQELCFSLIFVRDSSVVAVWLCLTFNIAFLVAWYQMFHRPVQVQEPRVADPRVEDEPVSMFGGFNYSWTNITSDSVWENNDFRLNHYYCKIFDIISPIIHHFL